MSYKFNSTNLIYIRNLSPLVTEADIRRTFQKCDEITQIVFNTFGATTQRYCKIEFKTAAGVTNSSLLNNELLYGIPMNISVVDPMSAIGTSPAPPTQPSTPMSTSNILEMAMHSHIASIHARQEAVQSAAAQAKLLAEKKMSEMGIYSTQDDPHTDNSQKKFEDTEQKMLEKTIYVDNFPLTSTEHDLKSVFNNIFGAVEDIRIDNLVEPPYSRFCLIQFANPIVANTSLNMDGFEFGGQKLHITKSKTTVRYKEPEGIQFDVTTHTNSIPVAYQQINKLKLEEKMAMVRAKSSKVIEKILKENSPDTTTHTTHTTHTSKAESKEGDDISKRGDEYRNIANRSQSSDHSRRSPPIRRSYSSSISRDHRRNYRRREFSPRGEPWWVKEGEKLREREIYKRHSYRRNESNSRYSRDRYRRHRYSPSPARHSRSTDSYRSSISRRKSRTKTKARSPSRRRRRYTYSSRSSSPPRRASISPSYSTNSSVDDHKNNRSQSPAHTKKIDDTQPENDGIEQDSKKEAVDSRNEKRSSVDEKRDEHRNKHRKKHKKSTSEHKKKKHRK